jgi:hypothetical protein
MSDETRKVWQPGTVYEFGEAVEPRTFTGFYYEARLTPGWAPATPAPGEDPEPTPTTGRTGPKEPVWSETVAGQPNVVQENATLSWARRPMPSITWEIRALYSSSATQPTWPITLGQTIADGNIEWTCETPAITDARCPQSWIAVIGASKVFSPFADVVRFSAVNNPLDWSARQDAGFLPTGMQASGDPQVRAMGLYRGNLVAWTNSSMQVWQIDPDPQRMTLLDVIQGIGCRWPRSVAAMQSDLFFLSPQGVRSVSVSAGTGSLAAGDVGTPIDSLIETILRTNSAVDPIGLYLPNEGQYWLIFPGDARMAFVLTLSPSAGVVAWSRYTFPWAVRDAIVHEGELVIRAGNDLYQLDHAATMDDAGADQPRVSIGVLIQWPWLDFGSPGTDKTFTGFDVLTTAPCRVSFGYDENYIDRFTRSVDAPAGSRVGGFLPLHCNAPSLSARVSHSGAEPFELQALTIYIQSAGGGPQ